MNNNQTEIKELIRQRLQEDIKYINSSQFREKNEAFRKKLIEIENHGNKMADKKHKANAEIKQIKNNLALLNSEYLRETNPEKLQEIEEKKKDLRLKLSNLEDLASVNISAIINGKYLADLSQHEISRERLEFDGAIDSCVAFYMDLEDLIKNTLIRLRSQKHGHMYFRNQDMLRSIEMNSFAQDDGWVSRKDFVMPSKQYELPYTYNGSLDSDR